MTARRLRDLRRLLQAEAEPHGSVMTRQCLAIERTITVDMADGQALPPFTEDGRVLHVVRRADGCTVWRKIFLATSPITPGAASSGDQSRAPKGT